MPAYSQADLYAKQAADEAKKLQQKREWDNLDRIYRDTSADLRTPAAPAPTPKVQQSNTIGAAGSQAFLDKERDEQGVRPLAATPPATPAKPAKPAETSVLDTVLGVTPARAAETPALPSLRSNRASGGPGGNLPLPPMPGGFSKPGSKGVDIGYTPPAALASAYFNSKGEQPNTPRSLRPGLIRAPVNHTGYNPSTGKYGDPTELPSGTMSRPILQTTATSTAAPAAAAAAAAAATAAAAKEKASKASTASPFPPAPVNNRVNPVDGKLDSQGTISYGRDAQGRLVATNSPDTGAVGDRGLRDMTGRADYAAANNGQLPSPGGYALGSPTGLRTMGYLENSAHRARAEQARDDVARNGGYGSYESMYDEAAARSQQALAAEQGNPGGGLRSGSGGAVDNSQMENMLAMMGLKQREDADIANNEGKNEDRRAAADKATAEARAKVIEDGTQRRMDNNKDSFESNPRLASQARMLSTLEALKATDPGLTSQDPETRAARQALVAEVGELLNHPEKSSYWVAFDGDMLPPLTGHLNADGFTVEDTKGALWPLIPNAVWNGGGSLRYTEKNGNNRAVNFTKMDPLQKEMVQSLLLMQQSDADERARAAAYAADAEEAKKARK